MHHRHKKDAPSGTAQEVYRLPLCEMRPENREKLASTMKKLGLVK